MIEMKSIEDHVVEILSQFFGLWMIISFSFSKSGMDTDIVHMYTV